MARSLFSKRSRSDDFKGDTTDGGEVYSRTGWYTPCRVKVLVRVSFDGGHRLTSAEGMQREAGCL